MLWPKTFLRDSVGAILTRLFMRANLGKQFYQVIYSKVLTALANRFFLTCVIAASALSSAFATSNYEYKPGEYVTIVDGLSPDHLYAIATHGEGDMGYDHFHVYLMDGRTGKKIGPLEEISETLDTGADAFYAKWSSDSSQVSITYRVDRHAAVAIRYRIANRRAYLISGPSPVDGLPQT
jgi:hypothetical protein